MDEQPHEYLKVPEVAGVVRIARSRAYELVGSGEIPSIRIGRSVRASRKELDALARGAAPSKSRTGITSEAPCCLSHFRTIR